MQKYFGYLEKAGKSEEFMNKITCLILLKLYILNLRSRFKSVYALYPVAEASMVIQTSALVSTNALFVSYSLKVPRVN